MTWHRTQEYTPEVRKMRHRVASLLIGQGLDIGCGPEKIVETAIGLDVAGNYDVQLDLSRPRALEMFSDGVFDYVFSSHCLEDMEDTAGTLAEWWRVIRPGGYLILYGPDPDYYPRIGTDGANPAHKHDMYWQEVWEIVRTFPGAKKLSATRHNESNEYSWQLIARKIYGVSAATRDLWREVTAWGRNYLPRKKKSSKELLIIRYGALGDSVWMTPVLRRLKADGWRITYNTTEYAAQVLRHCPWIDEFLLQPQDGVKEADLKSYWDQLERGGGFDRVINFSGSIEKNLLKPEGHEDYNWDHKTRHARCNKNYLDTTMAWAGYPEAKGERCELHYSETEETFVRQFREQHKDKFMVVWSLTGSSFHKHYPFTPYVVGQIDRDHGEEVIVVTVGEPATQMIEPRFQCVIAKAGHLGIRPAMCLTKYADLVIGPETGILNAASCYETPKIVMLSHSSPENLTKYWKNVSVIRPEACPCHPCHQLHYQLHSCPMGMMRLAPLCAENIRPEAIYEEFEKYFKAWKKGEVHEPPRVQCPKVPRALLRQRARRLKDVHSPRRRAV